MKRNILLTALILLVAGSWAFAGSGPSKVANTPHNLSYSSYPTDLFYTYAATDPNEEEICVYCHTPHGGTLDAPLWNRDLTSFEGAGKFTHYTSNTLTTTVGASNRAVNPESLVCLSCHDGSVAVGDSLLNTPNTTGTPNGNNVVKMQKGGGFNPGPKIGSSIALNKANSTATFDLSDDHPISFSYTSAQSDITNTGELQAVATVESAGLTLFGANKNVECSTCHDPHVDYINNATYDPFLAIPNTGSAMCLACHIK